MADKKLQGITIVIDGDTKGLTDALKDINRDLYNVNSELKAVNSALKLDPGNVELIAQKQTLLSQAVKDTTEKLEQLKLAQSQMKESGVDESSDKYRALTREISNTEASLKKLQTESKNADTEQKKLQGGIAGVVAKLKDGVKSGSIFGETLKANLASDLIKGSLSAITSGLKSVVSTGLEYNATMESYTKGITAMLDGDAAAAEKLIKDMSELASVSTFDTSSMVDASKALLSAGISAEKSESTIKALGNAIAFTGGGNAELTRMAQNLQQIQNVGKASSQDLKQFANAGIDVYGALSDYLGKDVAEIQKMDISFDDLSNALIAAGSEGGKYFGAMEASADTFNGQMGKMKSGLTELAGAITNDASAALSNTFLPAINDTIQAMTKGFQEDGIDGMLDALGKGLQDLTGKIVDALPDLVKAGVSLVVSIAKGIIKGIPDLVKKLPQIVKAIVDGIGELLGDIFDLGKDIVEGLWEGIKSLSGWLGEKVKGIGQTVVNGFKSFFGIHSPSTLMRDEIGENIALGIGEGIEEGMPSALKDVDVAMKQLNAGIEASVNPIINTNASTSPLIINIENFTNNRAQDVQSLAEELEIYRRNMRLAIGGE